MRRAIEYWERPQQLADRCGVCAWGSPMYRKKLTSDSLSKRGFFWAKTSLIPSIAVCVSSVLMTTLFSLPCAWMPLKRSALDHGSGLG